MICYVYCYYGPRWASLPRPELPADAAISAIAGYIFSLCMLKYTRRIEHHDRIPSLKLNYADHIYSAHTMTIVITRIENGRLIGRGQSLWNSRGGWIYSLTYSCRYRIYAAGRITRREIMAIPLWYWHIAMKPYFYALTWHFYSGIDKRRINYYHRRLLMGEATPDRLPPK